MSNPIRTPEILVKLIFLLAFTSSVAQAQMPRQRVDPGGSVDEAFWAITLVHVNSATNLARRNLNFNIKHSFGLVNNGVEDLFGLDAPANIRFGLDYGLTDWLSIGIGRSKEGKLYDGRFKLNVARQQRDDYVPVEVALFGNMAVTTIKNGYDLKFDRLSYMGGLIVARKMSERLSLQISPMATHFNTVELNRDIDNQLIEQKHYHLAIAFAAQLALTERMALLLEFIPIHGDRSDQTVDTFSAGLNIETGGHVFQLFFTSSQGMTEQHVITQNIDDFFAGDIRFGFNVHRIFSL